MRGMVLSLRTALGTRRARVFVALLLAAFLLQIAVTRSHFHFGGAGAHLAEAQIPDGDGTPPEPQKAPSGHDESKCPLWHASGICGAADLALASTFAPPISSHTGAQFDPRAVFPERFVASWRSRAPPSV